MRSSASLIVFITECAFLFLFLGGGKNKSNKKLKEKASTYNPSLMIPRMFKLTHPFLLRIITSKTSFLQIKLLFFGLVFLLHHISDSSSDVGFGLVMNNSGLSVSPCFSVFFHTSAGFVSLPVSPPLFDFHFTHVLHLDPPQVKAGFRSYLAEMLL